MDSEITKTVETARELVNPIQKYNISISENPNTWECYGIPVRPNRSSTLFPFLNTNDPLAAELSGGPIGREFSTIPEFPIKLGTLLPPQNIRTLTYVGESFTDQEMRSHLLRHEVGHAAINRDLAFVLQNAVPGNEILYLRTMMKLAQNIREKGAIPLSKLYMLHVYKTDEKKFVEDLAEMYAVRARSYMEGHQIWDQYQKLVTSSNPDLASLFGVIDELFKESQKLTYN